MNEVERLIAKLELQPLPIGGGFFRQTWVGAKLAQTGRPTGTAIYFLITPDNFSALHRLEADEVWHFYAGDPVELVMLDPPTGAKQLVRLGPEVLAGDVPQHVVPAEVWQGARLVTSINEPRGWALLGCTMAPGWDQRDFVPGNRSELKVMFPEAGAEIDLLTR